MNEFLSPDELATVLAALRHWQRSVERGTGGVPAKEREIATRMSPMHFATAEPLSLAEIDQLCERLNRSEP
jgi:hypothetical protein